MNYKNEYLELFFKEDNTSESMRKYYQSSIDMVIKLNNGKYLIIDKPAIKKDFCFGYGYCGISDQEDMQRANNLAKNARQNEDYFIKENLKDIDSEIMTLHYHILFIDGRYAEAEDFYRKNERLISYRDRMATPYFAEYYKHPRLVLEYIEESRIPYINALLLKRLKKI